MHYSIQIAVSLAASCSVWIGLSARAYAIAGFQVVNVWGEDQFRINIRVQRVRSLGFTALTAGIIAGMKFRRSSREEQVIT